MRSVSSVRRVSTRRFGEAVRPRTRRRDLDHLDAASTSAASNEAASCTARSRTKNRNRTTSSPRSMTRLRACWVGHLWRTRRRCLRSRCPGGQAMAPQRSRQEPDERGEHGSVRPLQAGSGAGAAEYGDLVPQHEELDVLGAGCATHQQEQPEHVLEDQAQQSNDAAEIMSGRRDHQSPPVSDMCIILEPRRCRAARRGRGTPFLNCGLGG